MRREGVLRVLEVMELILTMVAVILLTLLFRFETTHLRFVFLLLDIYLVYSFSHLLSNVSKKIQIRRNNISNKELDSILSI